MQILKISEFGEPILREVAKPLTTNQIKSARIKTIVNDMHQTLTIKKMGVGLAAPQVGKDLSLAIISIHPTKHRPKVKEIELNIFNPKITKHIGNRSQLWEGCISAGKSGLFAKVPRYKKIRLSYFDEQGKKHYKDFNGLIAQVIRHEVDHLNGILFIDKVKDTKTFMTIKEYKKMVATKQKK